MDAITRIIKDPTEILLALVVVFMAIEKGHSIFLWWKARADGYHANKSEEEDFHQQVLDIAKAVEEHAAALKRIGKALDRIDEGQSKAGEERKKDIAEMEKRLNEKMASLENERKSDLAATGRILLYQFYEKLKDKTEITAGELEAFNAIAERCVKAGVNGVFRGKIIPFIQAKSVEGR